MQRSESKKFASEYLRQVLNKDRESSLALIGDLASSKKYSLLEIFEVLVESQRTVGSMWASGTLTIADEQFATETTLESIKQTSQRLRKYHSERKGSVLLANFVEGEFHYVGLMMFGELLRSEGWDVEFYSSGPSVSNIFQHLQKTNKKFDLICISLTMSFNLKELQGVLKILSTNLLTKGSLIIVGSQLFKTKKIRDSLVDTETGLALADLLATNFEQGLELIHRSFPDHVS